MEKKISRPNLSDCTCETDPMGPLKKSQVLESCFFSPVSIRWTLLIPLGGNLKAVLSDTKLTRYTIYPTTCYDPADHPVALCPPSFSGARRTPSSTWAFWCWPRSRTTRASSWAACASACCCCCWGRCSCGAGTNTSTVRGGARRRDTHLRVGGGALGFRGSFKPGWFHASFVTLPTRKGYLDPAVRLCCLVGFFFFFFTH